MQGILITNLLYIANRTNGLYIIATYNLLFTIIYVLFAGNLE